MKQSGFAIILLVLLMQASAASASSFSDVPETSPYYNSVESLKTLKIITGYSDGTFHPSQPVNRAEALKMIMNSAGIYPAKGFYATGFKDITIDAWFAGYVMNGLSMDIVSGNPDGTFAPGRNVNKAEFLKMMLKTYQIDLAKHLYLSQAVSSDSKLTDWFTPYLSYAKTIGLVYPDLQNRLQPSLSLNRAACADIVYKMYIIKNGGETQKLLNIAESKLVDSIIQINSDNLEDALGDAEEAIFYSSKALSQEPQSAVTQSAYQISLSFRKLYLAYQAGLNHDFDTVRKLVTEAKELALKSSSIYAGNKILADKMVSLGDDLVFSTYR